MVHFIFLILIGSFSTVSHGSEASVICGDESRQKYLLGEAFHSQVKDTVQKGLLNPKNMFNYWAQESNISNNLWDSFDSCLTGNTDTSKDTCIANWSILSTNFYLFVLDLNHYKTCNLQKFEKNAQHLEQLSSLIEKTYKESQTLFHNLTLSVIKRYLKHDHALNLNKTAASNNESSSAQSRILACEATVHRLRSQYFNDSLARLKSGKWASDIADKFKAEIKKDFDCQNYTEKTALSDKEIESVLETRISSLCDRDHLNTKNRIICHWPTLRSRLLEYENGQKPSLVHMKWIPTSLTRSLKSLGEDNLPGLYLTYLLDLQKYILSSYFMLVGIVESDLTGSSSDVASWLAHDIGIRIAMDRFSQLQIECHFLSNIRSMGFSGVKTDACEKLNDSAELLLSKNEIRIRVSKELSSDYSAGDNIKDIHDTLKQLTGRPTRNELNTFVIPSLFRSNRSGKIVSQS
ncbi:MAG: hypothetical protein IPL83_07470 [Bdellovibrionales bacterium]|nr:hypothetical protein [Bdellovibrionales bacterium]